MAEFSRNLWAPWRMDYIRALTGEAAPQGCFLCRYWSQPECDRENHVVWRAATTLVVMNRFPYTNGHLIVAHAQHRCDFSQLSDAEMLEMSKVINQAVQLLRKTVNAEGLNVGYNLGHCAGAGLPDHIHAHVVPRWSGDTNFMAVIDHARVIPDSLDALYAELLRNKDAK